MSNESLICMTISRLARGTQVDCLKVGVVAQGVEGLLCKPEDLNLAPKDQYKDGCIVCSNEQETSMDYPLTSTGHRNEQETSTDYPLTSTCHLCTHLSL